MPTTTLMPQSLSTPTSPYHKVTVLTGEESFYSARKSWAIDQETGHPIITGDYNLGKFFCWRTECLTPGAELMSLYDLINRLSDESRSFIIYGTPEPWLPPAEKAQRKREFFHEPPAVQRLLVDVDGWQTDVKWWRGPTELRLALHTLLEGHGLGYLALNDCLVSLSQSAWAKGPLKCHLYYWLEEPVALSSLREWARAVNSRCGAKVLDPVVYGHVHIDYTASRRCQGFPDPFEGRRLTLLTGAGSEEGVVAGVRVVDGLLAELDAAGPVAGRDGASELADVGTGDAWAVLARSGQGGDINEYGYRAAARLVRDQGKDAVLKSITRLAEQMHQVAWEVIAVNSEGTRGGRKDLDTYTVSRYRQYLQSACDASIGDAVDRYTDAVRAALTTGSARDLLSESVLAAAARLKTGWPGLYQDLRREVKASRLVEMPVFNQAVDARVRLQSRAVRLAADEVDEVMERMEVDGVVAGRIVDDEGNVNEVEFYRAVAASFDVVQGSNQAVFLDRGEEGGGGGEDEAGYRVLPLMALPSAIVVRAMDLAQSLGINRSQLFTSARAQVGAMVDQYISEHRGDDGQGWVPSKVYGPREVTARWYRVPGSGVVWANLGGYRCVRVEGEEWQVMTWQQALQGWSDAPIWTSTVDVGVSDDDVRLGGEIGEDGVRVWIDELFRLIRVDTVEERVMILSWIMSAVLGWPIRYILQLYGLPGSGKSTTGDILCEIVHPLIGDRTGVAGGSGAGVNGMTLEGRSKERRSLADLRKDPAINLSGVDAVVIDNIDRLTRSSQNWLCQLSTGLGVTREIKYTHIKLRENLQTCCVLTGISTHDSQADYGERAFDVEIVKRRDGIGSPERYWREIRGRVIGGLIRFAGVVVEELKGRSEEGSEMSRDDLVQVVGRLVMGEDGAGGRGYRLGLASAERRVVQSAFSSCILVWIQNDPRAVDRWVSMSTFYGDYEKWVRANVGKVFRLRLPIDQGVDFRVRWVRDGVDFTSSNNAISFGRAFWQRAGDLASTLHQPYTNPTCVGLVPIERRRNRMGVEVRFNINDDDDQFLI